MVESEGPASAMYPAGATEYLLPGVVILAILKDDAHYER
jgi:hypothetical protein